MALSASLQITNSTGGALLVTNVIQINDDSTWAAPPTGTVIPSGQSVTIAMGNSSVFFAPKGCGCNFFFANESFQMGNIYLDIPAIGSYTLNGGSGGPPPVFNFAFGNPGGNSYTAVITLAS